MNGQDAKNSRDTYFAESGDKIRGFFEETALDKTGQLLPDRNINNALNKVGHALHALEPTFREITLSEKVLKVVQKITSFENPKVVQSMVIFKHPQIGGTGTVEMFLICFFNLILFLVSVTFNFANNLIVNATEKTFPQHVGL